jgi:cytidine deaminase
MKEQRGFRSFMEIALDEARAAGARGEVPVGACVVIGGDVVARAGNRTREFSDPTAHAEILAIRAACAALGSERLGGADLYVTLEPCCHYGKTPPCVQALDRKTSCRDRV